LRERILTTDLINQVRNHRRSIFLSYSWEVMKGVERMRQHSAWVRALGERLQRDRFSVVLDQFLDLTDIEAIALAQSVKVFLMVLTDTYGMKMRHLFLDGDYRPPRAPIGWNDGVTYDEVQSAILAHNNSGVPQFVCILREGKGHISNYPTVNMSACQSYELRYVQLRSVVDQLLEDPRCELLKKLPATGMCTYCDFRFDHSQLDVCHSCKQARSVDLTWCPNCGHRNNKEGTFVWFGFLNCFRCAHGVIIPTSTENLVVGRKTDFAIDNLS
jgi:hypothetical protein